MKCLNKLILYLTLEEVELQEEVVTSNIKEEIQHQVGSYHKEANLLVDKFLNNISPILLTDLKVLKDLTMHLLVDNKARINRTYQIHKFCTKSPLVTDTSNKL